MGIFNHAAWGVIIGLALMAIGGLVMWAYGARTNRVLATSLMVSGPEAEATRLFHVKLVRWFLNYGMGALVAGFIVLVWATFLVIAP
jgi:hypothetical protein